MRLWITSFECVSGIRLPSSSIREPDAVSISSSTRTFTLACTLTSTSLRGSRKTRADGSLCRVPRGEPVHRALGDADEHLGRQCGRRVVRVLADHGAAYDADRLTEATDFVAHGAADEATDERAPRAATWLELPGREDLVVDASILQRALHEADHLGFGHGP